MSEEKYKILKQIFIEAEAGIAFASHFEDWEDKLERFIRHISQDSFTLADYKGIAPKKLRDLIQFIWPDKPAGSSIKLDKWLMALYDYRRCNRCNTIKKTEDFSFNKTKSDGLNCQCRCCQQEQTTKSQPARQARYKAAKLGAIVPWTELDKIAIFYSLCPPGYQVDHIIPLQGRTVCGLHVLNNLQYLTITDNLKKHNKFAG